MHAQVALQWGHTCTPSSLSAQCPVRRAEILPKEEGLLLLTSSGRFWIQEPHVPFGWECDDLLVI